MLVSMRALSGALLALALAVAVMAGKQHHCMPRERVVFSCVLGERVVSLCASANLGRDTGAVYYRYGRPGLKPELEYPDGPVHPRKAYTAHYDSWAKGSYAAITFRIGEHAYHVYSRHAAFEEHGRSNGAGVDVYRNGARVSDLWCDDALIEDHISAVMPALALPETPAAQRRSVLLTPPRARK
jgi:hypothetical protein